MMRGPGRSRGFSLIELMVTVTVLVLITLASMPMFTTWIANTRVRTAAEAMQNGARLAQAEAVRRNGNVTLRLSADKSPSVTTLASPTGTSWVMLDGTNALLVRKGIEGADNVTMSPKNLDDTAADEFTGDIVFNGFGGNNLGGTLKFVYTAANADRPLAVILTPGGRVRMCDSQRAAGDPQSCA